MDHENCAAVGPPLAGTGLLSALGSCMTKA